MAHNRLDQSETIRMSDTKEYLLSDAKYLKLNLQFDHLAMLEEAKNLKDRYVRHRPGSYQHNGWLSLCLHGLGEDKTESWKSYGYNNAIEAADASFWTDAAKECPTIMNFIHNEFPSNSYARVRLMLLEANGNISMHTDTQYRILENISLVLSNPAGCVWTWEDGDTLFMEPGCAYAMNISYGHSVQNNSDEDRYHIILHRHDSTPEWKALMNESMQQQGIIGQYFEGPNAT
jgi:Aspartyl/Asparaginyl beta-hydroxylase